MQVLLGLAHLHERRVMHRDVKPANVFLFKGGRALLGDLGVAKVLLQGSADHAQTFVGSPAYMAPEVGEAHPYGPSSDIWAYGCIAFEMCSLRCPFEAASAPALYANILQGRSPVVRGRYSAQLRGVAGQSLRRQAAKRPSAAELLRTAPILREAALSLGAELPLLSQLNHAPCDRRRSAEATGGKQRHHPGKQHRRDRNRRKKKLRKRKLRLECRRVFREFSQPSRPLSRSHAVKKWKPLETLGLRLLIQWGLEVDDALRAVLFEFRHGLIGGKLPTEFPACGTAPVGGCAATLQGAVVATVSGVSVSSAGWTTRARWWRGAAPSSFRWRTS
ncbi:unnamed protein product [Polarella glacialis]|uniref:non-specific serine/threonine protein kinase n=1 Tax=Polarella glacialis TaxID=89957 RepID=A0A813KP71_POLGL|nr:unnamed protein product [Polarella glacialis]